MEIFFQSIFRDNLGLMIIPNNFDLSLFIFKDFLIIKFSITTNSV